MKRRPLHGFKVEPRCQRGAVLILVVAAMVAILMMAALALDGGHMLMNKARLQNAVDAAALSGAKTLSRLEGGSGDCFTAEEAALNTFTRNAEAEGNEELLESMGTGADAAATFAKVKFSPSVYGPFEGFSSCSNETPARYVQVSVPSYGLVGFFWGFVQSFGGSLGAKSVAAVATAGPSPTSPCELAPLVVCAKSDDADSAWGFGFGELQVLKTAAGDDSPIGPGNFQLLDLSGDLTGTGGAKTVGQLMAGGGYICPTVRSTVETKPGNTVGQSVKGLNTRFGVYKGNFSSPDDSVSEVDYPPDWITYYGPEEYFPTQPQTQDSLILNDGVIAYGKANNGNGQGGSFESVSSVDGNITTESNVDLFDYNDWRGRSADCADGLGTGCQFNPGAFGRRILRVVIGDCPEGSTDGGTNTLEVLGFGCYFVLQPADQSGSSAQIFGQFVETCDGDGVPGPNPTTDKGPEIIQLYKTYVDGTPSNDS